MWLDIIGYLARHAWHTPEPRPEESPQPAGHSKLPLKRIV
jgi:hypothetical protein